MAKTTTPQNRESHKKLKPKPKTESKSWQTRNMARKEKQTAQVSASGGARGLGPDRLAKGGDNPNPVKVTVTPAEIETFKKGIA